MVVLTKSVKFDKKRGKRPFKDGDSRVRILYCPKDVNEGSGAAAQYGLDRCSHELLARIDSDDVVAHPMVMGTQLTCFKCDETLSSVGASVPEYMESPFITLCVVGLCANVPEVLVEVKAEDGFYTRRGGYTILVRILKCKANMLHEKQIRLRDSFVSAASLLLVCVLLNALRSCIYRKLLR